MKIAMTALAVVFLAQAAPAMAQERGDRPDRGNRQERMDRPERDGADRSQRDWNRGDSNRGEGRAPRPADAAPAPQAPRPEVAPQAPQAGDRARFRGDGRYGQPGPGRDQGFQDRGDNRPRVDDRRGDDRRDGAGRGDDRRNDGPRGDGRRGDDRRDWNGRNDNDRRDWNGRNDNDRRDWDRRGDGRRWERGRYPSSYFSAQRYRYAWRPPSGFYLRTWAFGEFYPRNWFGDGYWIADPWRYDLPLPPPGFDWVRSGPDALLIDQFSGRIVQVVRDAFWY